MNVQILCFTTPSKLRAYLFTLFYLFLNTGLPLLPVSAAQNAQPSNSQNSQTLGLPEGAIFRLGKGVMGGSDRAIAFSPDRRILAAGSRDGIKLWDVSTRKKIATFSPDDKTARFSAAFSPDDNMLAVGTGSGKIELWDVKTGKKIVTRHAHGGITFSVVFSPDGKTIASGSQDGTALLWNVSELTDK